MIHARVTYDNRRGRVRLELLGHAGAAPRGEDLVCAGVSALALTAAKSAEHLHRRGLLRRCPKVRLLPGNSLIIATAQPGCEAEVLMVFWTIQAGIHALAQMYPDHVSLEQVMKV